MSKREFLGVDTQSGIQYINLDHVTKFYPTEVNRVTFKFVDGSTIVGFHKMEEVLNTINGGEV